MRQSDPDYGTLASVLQAAYDQAASGKGKERHARGKPFHKQPIMEISRMVGTGFTIGQAIKKLQEANAMAARGELEAAQREALGAINYAAAFYLLLSEQESAPKENTVNNTPDRQGVYAA